MRIVKTNILDTLDTLRWARDAGTVKHFDMSTDKAQNPANLMGATKRIMEAVIFGHSGSTAVSTARLVNVAFSDGSLLADFRQRLLLGQPLAATSDIRCYFVTGKESGLLCLASIVLGRDREIFFSDLDAATGLLTFAEIAIRFLEADGMTSVLVKCEDEARGRAEELIAQRRWPCYFFASDTSREKPFEEFYAPDDAIDWSRFADVGVIARPVPDAAVAARAADFLAGVSALRHAWQRSKKDLVTLIATACPELDHIDTGRSLDHRM